MSEKGDVLEFVKLLTTREKILFWFMQINACILPFLMLTFLGTPTKTQKILFLINFCLMFGSFFLFRYFFNKRNWHPDRKISSYSVTAWGVIAILLVIYTIVNF